MEEQSSSSESSAVQSVINSFVISEVMWMGTDLSTADEWVELAAVGDESLIGLPAVLSGWTLVLVKDGVESIIVRFSSGTTIPIGGYGIVSNYPAAQSRLAVAPLAVSTGMSLPNTKLLLRLYDPQNVLRDEVDDGVGNPFAGINTSQQKGSMERIDLRMPGNAPSNWRSATQSIGFDPFPFPLYGTPGSSHGVAQSSLSSAASSSSSTSSASSISSISSVSSIASTSVVSSSSMAPIASLPLLRINELLPNPVGSDDAEWIEILNVGSGSVSTAGITLSMSGGTARALPLTDLLPSVPVLLPKSVTGLSLPNAGGTVVLKQGSMVLDSFDYPSVPEGISAGRADGNATQPFCLPSPGSLNVASGATVAIDIQSGLPTGNTVTLNLALRTLSGSTAGGQCRWEYPDGYVSESCNPPSHSVDSFGAGEITLRFTDYCGTTMIQSLPIFVTKKPKKMQEEDKNGILGFSCLPSAFTGALITEILPNPVGDEAAGEWMEVRNVSGRDLPLCGWALEDASGTRFDLSRLRLPLDETLLFTRERTDITLNNDADSVRLIAPDSLGGSGTTLQEVTFTTAPDARSYALREDGLWLWTPLLTPGTTNAFPEVPLPRGPATARIVAAMPNPKGADEGVEWVEIQNLTGRPLWMQKWTLRAGKDASLSGKAIHPYATQRFLAAELGLTLRNSSGALQLFDEQGVEMSVLAWQDSPGEDEIMSPPVFQQRIEGVVRTVDEGGGFVIDDGNGGEKHSIFSGLNLYIDKCPNLGKALLENKKVELFFNTDMHESVVLADGYDAASFFLKSGCATVSHLTHLPFLRGYDLHEREALQQRRGVWQSEESILAMRHRQQEEDLIRTVRTDGLQLISSLEEDLIHSGSILSFQTNLPAHIFVSLNDAPFVRLETGAILSSDAVVQAYAELVIGSGTTVRSDMLEKEYILFRDSYEQQALLSEVYPSPKKGEKEWVELYNGSPYPINLAGWQIDDGPESGSRPVTLTSDHRLGAFSYLVLQDLKVAWNNGGDDVRLIAPDGSVIDSITYPKVKTGTAYGVHPQTFGVSWCLTEHHTQQKMNECYISPKKKNSRSALKKSKKSSSGTRKISYKNIVQNRGLSPILPPLFQTLSSSFTTQDVVFLPLRWFALFLLFLYLGVIACYARLRRY